MEMQQTKKLSLFAGASIFLHVIIAIAASGLLDKNNKIIVSTVDSYNPLIVSMARNSSDQDVAREDISTTAPIVVKKLSIQSKREAAVKENHNSNSTNQRVKHKNTPRKPDETRYSAAPDIETPDSEIALSETLIESNVKQTEKNRGFDERKNSVEKSTLIRKKLNALVEKNFNYPRFAVKRGWEGTVELGVRIEANGRLSNVRVVKTSGYSILDEAALTTLSQTNYINGIESWLAGNYFDTTLPVKYLLVGG